MKKLLMVFAVTLISAFVFAYNPPAGGQNLFNLSSPTQLTSASSAAGGGIFYPGPDSIAFNPALPSFEDRVQLDTGFSILVNKGEGDSGAAIQTGILIPMKMFNLSGLLNGVFLSAEDMDIEKTINFKAGLSKEVSEKLSVGLNLDAGYMWGAGDDWSLGAGLGALYRRESLGFAKDFRLGASLLNLGKYYKADVLGIKGYKRRIVEVEGVETEVISLKKSDSYPAMITLRAGTAANLVSNNSIVIGASFDVTTPSFQNLVFDAGLQFGIKDLVFVNIAERLDLAEIAEGSTDFLPAIGLSVKFNLNAKNSYLSAHNWQNSEILASGAWQQKYDNIEVVSAGMRVKLGQKDLEPPVIKIWNED